MGDRRGVRPRRAPSVSQSPSLAPKKQVNFSCAQGYQAVAWVVYLVQIDEMGFLVTSLSNTPLNHLNDSRPYPAGTAPTPRDSVPIS